MIDLKCGDHVRGNIVRTSRTAEGIVLGIHERTVSIETLKGERTMLDKKTIENIGIGARIKARRMELDISQKSLAQSLSVAQPNLSQWETGKLLPPKEMIEAIEAELGISLAEEVNKAAFNGVTTYFDPSVIKEKTVAPLRERDILDKEGNFKNKVPAFKEPVQNVEAVEKPFSWTNHLDKPTPMTVAPPHPWRTYETEVAAKVEPAAVVPENIRTLELKPEDQGIYIRTDDSVTLTILEPTIDPQPLDLDEILTSFFPRFGNFHADYQLAGAFELLLQAEAGNACLDDLRKARAKLDKAIACLEK